MQPHRELARAAHAAHAAHAACSAERAAARPRARPRPPQLLLAVCLHAAVGFLFEDCDTLSGDCEWRFLMPSAPNSSFVLGDWMPEAYKCDFAMLGGYLAVLATFNGWYAARVWQIKRRVRDRLCAERLCTRRGGALEGYVPSRLVLSQPTGRPEFDIPAELGRRPPRAALGWQVVAAARRVRVRRLRSTSV